MVDQIALVDFTSPASPGTLDITSSDITETFKGAILIFTKETSDGTDNDHGVIGIGFVGNDVGQTTEERCGSIQVSQASATTPDCNSDQDANLAINAMAGNNSLAHIEAAFSAVISGGVRLNFTTTTSRTKGTAILFAGLANGYTDGATGAIGGASEGVGGTTDFEPDAVVFLASDTALTGDHQDADPNIGFAVNKDSGIEQVAAYVNFDDATEPTDSDGYLRSDDAFAHFAPPARAMEYSHIDAFTSTGFDHTSNTGTPDAHYLALKFLDAGTQLFAGHLSVAASTGTQSFNVGFQPLMVFGMATLLTSQDTLTDGPTASAMGYFAFSPTYQRAYTVHREEGKTNVAAAAFNAHTRQEDVALLLYDHTGSIVQRATLSQMTGTGFDLSFSTGSAAGTITILAIGAGDQTIVQSDTETISDDVLVMLFRSLVDSDTVTITETALLGTNDVTITDGPEGYTFNARAERGTAYTAGAEAGTSF